MTRTTTGSPVQYLPAAVADNKTSDTTYGFRSERYGDAQTLASKYPCAADAAQPTQTGGPGDP